MNHLLQAAIAASIISVAWIFLGGAFFNYVMAELSEPVPEACLIPEALAIIELCSPVLTIQAHAMLWAAKIGVGILIALVAAGLTERALRKR